MANKLSQRIKYAMAHLSRKQHISLLARPNWRKIQRTDVNILPNPYTTRRTALRSRASKRIKKMAQPKYVNKKYDPERAPLPYPRVNPKTLEAKCSRRIMDLAIPKKRQVVAALRFTKDKHLAENLSEQLWRVQNSRYRKYRVLCNLVLQREARRKQKIWKKLRRALKKPEDWDRHMDVLDRLAAPKKIHRPRLPDRRRRWRPVNMRRVEELAQPLMREVPEGRDPYTVSPAALTYDISDRMKFIALPPEIRIIPPPKELGVVQPAALLAVATPRLINLAKPVERPAGTETDLREDAFKVSPAALKARCSRRLKRLARPKNYR